MSNPSEVTIKITLDDSTEEFIEKIRIIEGTTVPQSVELWLFHNEFVCRGTHWEIVEE